MRFWKNSSVFWKNRSDFGRNGVHFKVIDQDLEELIRVWKDQCFKEWTNYGRTGQNLE